jgi:HAD superfamily hydrolase (TIGR01509 family)
MILGMNEEKIHAPIRAVIFDMNGVIVDDESIHEQAFHDTVKPFGVSLSHKDYQRIFLGKSDAMGLQLFYAEHPLHISLSDIGRSKMDRYWELVRSGIPVVHHAVDTIRRLSLQYTLAVTTGAARSELDAVFDQLNIRSYFSVVVTVEEFTHSKPHPEAYLLTSERLHIPPHQCTVIEDAPAGINAAKKAGMRCVGITTTHTAEVLMEADVIVDSLGGITESLING